MKFELRPYQKEAVNAVYEHLRTRDDNPCVVLPTGCHEKGHPILMYDGSIKKVEDIEVGDVIKSGSLKPATVIRLVRGYSSMLKVSVGNRTFRVNTGHIFHVADVNHWDMPRDLTYNEMQWMRKKFGCKFKMVKTNLSRKHLNLKLLDFSVTELYKKDDYYGFTIDTPSHLYVDGYGLIHHNCGKSLVIAQIVSDAVQKWNGRVLILAHVKELLEQNADKIKKLCPDIDIGIYSAGLHSRDKRNQVIVAGIQSVYRRACELDKFDIVIVDECHLIPTDGEGQYRTFFNDEKVVNPNVRIIGLTATPFRLHGGMICSPENIMNHVCYEAGLKEMIVQGYLSPIIPKSGGTVPDLSDLHIRAGEFIQDEVDKKMNNERLVKTACYEIVQQTQERKSVLIFGSSVSHCKKIKKAIEELTHEECAIVTGDTPSGERAEILDRIKGKEVPLDLWGAKKKPLKYLVNMGVLTTGFDAPNIDCVAILRPTASAGLLVQMVGRGLRLSPQTGKRNCLILDYGDNIMRHGPLDAIRIEAKGKRSGEKKGEPPVKKCPECNALVELSRAVCPYCGHQFPPRDLKHELTASEDGLLTGQISETTKDVQRVRYSKWIKKQKEGDTKQSPPTVCVEYTLGLNQYHKEWLCPEHTGYARKKFVKWWEEHRVDESDDAPETVEDVIELSELNLIKFPVRITVKHIAGEKFDRISGYEYGPAPDTQYEDETTPFDTDPLFGKGTYMDRMDSQQEFSIEDDTPF